MRPVKQTVFPSPGIRGDCFRACIASILEEPIENVPHFVAIEHDWWGETRKWLATRNLTPLWIRLLPDELILGNPADDIYFVLNGPSPRGNGLKHSVVGQIKDGWNFTTIFDPHPSGDGLAGLPESAMFFLPLRIP